MALTYDDIKNSEFSIIFGHRGFSAKAPENTLPAFELLLKHKIQAVELDVHMCKSGELVIIHDHDTKKVGNINLNIEESTFKQLQKVDVAHYFKDENFKDIRIPTLNQVFDLLKDKVFYDVELKPTRKNCKELTQATVNLIREYGLEDSCMVSSFDPIAVRQAVKAGIKNTATIYSKEEIVPWFLRHGEGRIYSGSNILKPRYSMINKTTNYINTKILKYDLMTWTVDSEEEAERLSKLGVKGICANDPLKLKSYFDKKLSLL